MNAKSEDISRLTKGLSSLWTSIAPPAAKEAEDHFDGLDPLAPLWPPLGSGVTWTCSQYA